MTQTTPPGPAPGAPDRVFTTLRDSGVRRRGDGWIGGVCGAVADRVGVHVGVVRALWVVALGAAGVALPAYLLACCLLPAPDGRIHLERAVRSADAGSIVLSVVTAISLVDLLSSPPAMVDLANGTVIGHGTSFGVWVLAGAAVVVLLLYRQRAGRNAPSADAGRTPLGTEAHGTDAAPRPPYAPVATPAIAASGAPSPAPSAGAVPLTAGALDRRTGARPRVGWRGLLATIGCSAVAAGVVLLARGTTGSAGSAGSADSVTLSLAAALAAASGCGLVAGLKGLRGGLVGLLVILLALGTLGSAVPRWGAREWAARDESATHWFPTADRTDFRQSSGGAVLDLTDAPVAMLAGRTVRARVGAGALRVVVPSGVVVEVGSHVTVGGWQRDGVVLQETSDDSASDRSAPADPSGTDGPGGGRAVMAGANLDVVSVFGPAGADPSTPRLVVDASVGTGTLTIEESAR